MATIMRTSVISVAAAMLLALLLLSVAKPSNCYRQLAQKDTHPDAAADADAGAAVAEAKAKGAGQVRNDCPQTAPWPCKNGQCLSFAFICDGRKDCVDGFDEDKALCIAKDRPASVIIERFIRRFHSWLVPEILGNGSPKQLATLLTEERSLRDYAKKVGLNNDQRNRLMETMEFARDGRVLDLIMEGMPEEAYREAYVLFGRIVDSGFLGYDAARK